MYVYIQSEPRLWTAGFYDPSGKWQPESDHSSKEEAADRINYLNGGEKVFKVRRKCTFDNQVDDDDN